MERKERQGGQDRHNQSKTKPPEQSPHSGGNKSLERQLLPNVWDVLERKVRINGERSSGRITREEHAQEWRKANLSLKELEEKGTDRDRIIEVLYNEITMEPSNSLPLPVKIKDLSLDEFHQLRSKVEPMSDDEIREEIRKKEEEHERKRQEFYKRNGDDKAFWSLAKP